MNKRARTSTISPERTSGSPTNPVQNGDEIETRVRTASAEEVSRPRVGAILAAFPVKPSEHGCFGMEIKDVSIRPVFVKPVEIKPVEGGHDEGRFVEQTDHRNLLNLIDFSLEGNLVHLSYERPGMPLARLKQFEMIDRIAVATICKKVPWRDLICDMTTNECVGNTRTDLYS